MTTRHFIVTMILAAAVIAGLGVIWRLTPPKIVDLVFGAEGVGTNGDELTLRSIQKVGKFYTVSYHGDYEQRLRWFRDEHLKLAGLKKPSNCSLFVVRTPAGEPLLGRNLDRRDIPVLARFAPPGKYASYALSPSYEVHLHDVLVANPTEAQRNNFLFCLPFYPTDGINEKGLTIAIAGAPIRRIKQSEARTPMFVLHFIRSVLDDCQNAEEVARFAETVTLYDRAIDTISHHFLVTDATGQWLVIDYPEGELRITRGEDEPQARTNHFLEGGPSLVDTQTSFSRYAQLESALNSANPPASTAEAMALLRRVRDGTAWSVVYDAGARKGLLAVRENYQTQYRFGFSQ
ncbi:linear amide C-N hydrolase [candidate division KSB1 bacterium]|nr:linear amide C-N hydrolase [candidate division KSB1 bacterium]